MILLAKRGISARYIARCLSRILGRTFEAEEVEQRAFARAAAEQAR